MIPTMDRPEYLEDLRISYLLDELSIDQDDPRTTVGLTNEEIAYIRGEN